MIDYLEGNTSKKQSTHIQLFIKQHPYYEDILDGLIIELETFLNKEKVLNHLKEEKKKASTLVFSSENTQI